MRISELPFQCVEGRDEGASTEYLKGRGELGNDKKRENSVFSKSKKSECAPSFDPNAREVSLPQMYGTRTMLHLKKTKKKEKRESKYN